MMLVWVRKRGHASDMANVETGKEVARQCQVVNKNVMSLSGGSSESASSTRASMTHN